MRNLLRLTWALAVDTAPQVRERARTAGQRAAAWGRRTRTATMSLGSFAAMSAGVWDMLGRGWGLIAVGAFGLVLERLTDPSEAPG